jgi:RHS repeat-associated protein
VAIRDGNDNRTEYEYDELGRQIKVTDALGNETRTEYDGVGNVVATVDGNGNKTELKYDARNRQVEVVDAEGGVTSTEYDDVGNVTSVTDPVNNTTTYEYDAQNRLIAETNELGYTRSFEYDDVGNQIQTTDRNGRIREFEYDGLNRQIAENWLDSNGNTIRTTNSEYDGASQLITTSDPDSSYTFAYDNLGRLITVDNAGTEGVANVVLAYQYDDNGNIVSVNDSIDGVAGANTGYVTDELDRVTSITQSGNDVADKRVDFDYDAIGQYESISRYSDLDGTDLVVESSYSYDDANRLTNLTHGNSTTEIANYDLTYDAASRITQIKDVDGTSNYTYDKTNQLVGSDRTSLPDESYTYDKNGNRTMAGYVTGENNQLLSDGKYNYEYDKEGNLVKQTAIATGKVQEFQWDYHNRLVAVIDKNAAGVATQIVKYQYDLFGRRLSMMVDKNPSDAVDGKIIYFVYDRDNVILDFVDADGVNGSAKPVLDKRYLHGTGVDQVLAQEDGNGNVQWHLSDHLGSVKDLVGNSGVVLNHFTYDSFGSLIGETNPEVNTRYLYTGREWDEAIQLRYHRGRYANANGFISLDPIGFKGGDTNLYRYVGNSPLSFVDLFGTTSDELIALLGTYSHPSPGKRTIYIYNEKFSEYSTALSRAEWWFWHITDPTIEKVEPGKGPVQYIPWTTKGIALKGPTGKAVFRPGGRSGYNPTIELQKDRGGYHNTPNHPASEIKFEPEDQKDDRCPYIPPIPEYRPKEKQSLDDIPYPIPEPNQTPEPAPWWENIPDIPFPGLPDWLNPWRQQA